MESKYNEKSDKICYNKIDHFCSRIKFGEKIMFYNKICVEIQLAGDDEASKHMAAYMRDQFSFLGVKTDKRREITKPYFKNDEDEDIDWNFVNLCWKNPYREFQYVALDYLELKQDLLGLEHMEKLKEMAKIKPWWDTIDGLDGIIGNIVKGDIEGEAMMLDWSKSDDFWIRRLAIDHQLKYKKDTNTKLLEAIIENNLGDEEFFINKAIGWSLREYSKTNPEWVKKFIDKNKDKMDKLSIREASKYLK